MRIVVFHSQFTEVGGAEILALHQAHYLRGQGDQVELVTFEIDREKWEDAIRGLPLTFLERKHWKDKLLKWSSRHRAQSQARRMGRDIGRLSPDLVLAHNPPSNTMLGQSGLKIPKVWYCHEPPRYFYPKETNRHLYSAISSGIIEHLSPGLAEMVRDQAAIESKIAKWKEADQEGVKGLNRVLANSEYTKTSVEAVYGVRGVEVVNPMIRFRDSPRRRSGIDRRGLKILVQTRMEAIKNVDTVLRGFARVRSRLGSDAFLHLVGTGNQLPYLRELAGNLNVLESVRFHGFLGECELESVRSACDVFAMLPWDEPFGMVFPESAAAGLLLVGSDHGGPQEILENGRFGWNIPAWSPDALGEVFERVWALSDSEVDQRRNETSKVYRARYSPEVIGVRLRNLLCDV